MKVKESVKFDSEFPETFPWSNLDSIVGSNAGEQMAAAILQEVRLPRPESRHLIPGLRSALRILASVVDFRTN